MSNTMKNGIHAQEHAMMTNPLLMQNIQPPALDNWQAMVSGKEFTKRISEFWYVL